VNADVLIARQDFATRVGGTTYRVWKGATVRRGHPLVKVNRCFFETFDELVERRGVDFDVAKGRDPKTAGKRGAP